MADRIDSQGYFLTPDGRRDNTRSAEHAHWQKVIHDTWVKGHGKEPMPQDYTIMVVEKGDCQWTIAEDAGADPVETAYTINEQFTNPDLIMPDQVVFLPPSTQYRITVPKAGQTGEPHDNTDIFAGQTDQHASTAGTRAAASPSRTTSIPIWIWSWAFPTPSLPMARRACGRRRCITCWPIPVGRFRTTRTPTAGALFSRTISRALA